MLLLRLRCYRCCPVCRHDNAQLAAKASELEKGARKLNHRIKELENERDKHASRAQVADIQLTEAKEALAAAGQAANLKLQYLQQEHQQALAAAKQQHAESIADLERQLAAAKQAAAAGSEREAAVAAEREAAMAAALADARAAVQAQQEQHAELEQRHRKALQRYQAQIRQLETEKLELLSDSGDAGTSLLRQIQSLAAQASAAQASAADQEQLLLGKLRMAEKVAAEAAAAERDAAGRAASAEAALVATKEAAAAAVQVGNGGGAGCTYAGMKEAYAHEEKCAVGRRGVIEAMHMHCSCNRGKLVAAQTRGGCRCRRVIGGSSRCDCTPCSAVSCLPWHKCM